MVQHLLGRKGAARIARIPSNVRSLERAIFIGSHHLHRPSGLAHNLREGLKASSPAVFIAP